MNTGVRPPVTEEIRAYPNPFRELFYLRFRHSIRHDLKFELLDMTGKLVFEQILPSVDAGQVIRLHPGRIPPGPYFPKLVSGENITIKLLIKQ